MSDHSKKKKSRSNEEQVTDDGLARMKAQLDSEGDWADDSGRNPLNGATYSSQYHKLRRQRAALPATREKQRFLSLFSQHQCLVVVGETGSGKTTQIPQYVLEALDRLAPSQSSSSSSSTQTRSGCVACTQPRRVAAMSVAERVAAEMDVQLGDEVGYSIRFDHRASERTRLKYLTDGMLLREAMNDPELSAYQCIILDEAHERTLNTDVLFGLVRRLLRKRADLRVIVMSATLEHQRFQSYFFEAPLFKLEGRMYQVQLLYSRRPQSDYLDAAVRTAVQVHVVEPPGDILIFLTGADEINDACASIRRTLNFLKRQKRRGQQPTLAIDDENDSNDDDDDDDDDDDEIGPVKLIALYSALAPHQQQEIFCPAPAPRRPGGPPGRKIIVSTNIAETSLTIDGIVYVIDCGFTKEKVYNPRVRVESLAVTPISRASAQQRAGRAGRTREGKCFRLYTEDTFCRELAPQTYPEILRSNLAPVVLLLLRLGVTDIVGFDYMDPPAPEALVRALEELHYLGAIDDWGKLTELGRQLSEFPVPPQLALMLLSAAPLGCAADVASIAAMLSSPPCFLRDPRRAADAARAHALFAHASGDHLTLLNVYNAFCQQPPRQQQHWCRNNYLNHRVLTSAVSVRRQLLDILVQLRPDATTSSSKSAASADILRCVASGFFMQVAFLQRSGLYVTVKDQQSVMVHPSSALPRKPDWVIFTEFVLTTQNYVRGCSAITPDLLLAASPSYYDPQSFSQGEVQRALQRCLDDRRFFAEQTAKKSSTRTVARSKKKSSR